jgi:hypothetical protein
VFEVEPGDQVVGIRDGFGRFIRPRSPDTVAAILASLPGTQTQIIVRDVRGSGNWVYTVNFGANAANRKLPAGAPKVVVILIGDTNDKKIRDYVRGTLNSVKQVMEEKAQAKYVREIVEIKDRQFDKQRILNAINKVSVGENDTVLCFINCHGAHDPRVNDYSNGHWFHMSVGDPLHRTELRQALELKGARLTCLISESCNIVMPLPLLTGAGFGEENKKFESLFLNAAGVVDLNSSSPGEYSFAAIFGSVFVTSLIGDKATSWKEYTDELRALTDELYKDRRRNVLENRNLAAKNPELFAAYRDQEAQTVMVYEMSIR